MEVRPGTARVQVTELSGSGCINPTPAPKRHEDPHEAIESYLSPERLKRLSGTQDLSRVTYLEVCVDSQKNTLGDFGVYLPKLEHLKMNNSSITSLRDLGTHLSHLQVLWISCCCLQDLNGISTFSSLKELYLAYNNVSNLSQVAMLENLQLLDLEGNCVDDLIQIQYLGLCPDLHTLSLEGNPVCTRPNPTSPQVKDYNYRAAVRELVPQLRYLDDVKMEEERLTCCSTMREDWNILRISVQQPSSSETAEKIAGNLCPYNTHTSPSRPSTFPASTRTLLATRQRVLSPPGSRPDFDLAAVEAESSALTHGAGKILFCGNPVQAVRARREKLKTAPTRSSLTPRDHPIHVPEHTYDLEEPNPGERVNVFAELKAWRELNSKHLDIREKEHSPQILVIHHFGEEKTESEEEEEGLGGMKCNSSDEEHEEKHCDSLAVGSPDSSFHSLSPDQNQPEAFSPDMAPLSLSPSPPLHSTAAPSNRKLPRIHARRLRLIQSNSDLFTRRGLSPRTMSTAGEIDLISERLQHLSRTTYLPHSSLRGSQNEGPINSSADMDMHSLHMTPKQKMSKGPERPIVSRPHTAKAALQKHHLHHLSQAYRGSSLLD